MSEMLRIGIQVCGKAHIDVQDTGIVVLLSYMVDRQGSAIKDACAIHSSFLKRVLIRAPQSPIQLSLHREQNEGQQGCGSV